MTQSAHSSVFEKSREPHTIIIARGDAIRHFTIRPWLFISGFTLMGILATSVVLSAGYLLFRDDIASATAAHNARLRQGYEGRISLLRAQLERVTSRQMLDQELMQTKVAELLQRQVDLTERQKKLAPLLGNSEIADITAEPSDTRDTDTPPTQPLGYAPTPMKQDNPFSMLRLGDHKPEPANDGKSASLTPGDNADRLFLSIKNSIEAIEIKQESKMASLTERLIENATEIENALKTAGLHRYITDAENDAIGGPYIGLEGDASFDMKVAQLDLAMTQFDKMIGFARSFPLTNPSPGTAVSSTFGIRRDPLLGRPAMHAGMDFAVPSGTPVRATAAGTVIAAGPNGGYGTMIEIQHTDGFSTRYAHLNHVLVQEGQKVEPGDMIGRSGNTGRSTGPHLHYEIRRDGDAINPLPFINAGHRIGHVL